MTERAPYPVADEATLRRAGWGCAFLLVVFGLVFGLALHFAGRFLGTLGNVEDASPSRAREASAESAGSGAPTVLPWQTSYAAAVVQASREQRPMLLHFEADWATGARRMRDEVYVDPEVVERLRRFVLVRLELGAEPALEERLGVTGAPHLVFLSPSGDRLREDIRTEVDAPTLRAALDSLGPPPR